jgi:DNA-binding NarL/FixJ family response regulator
MDINLPGLNGIECIRHIRGKSPSTQFMMFTVYENDEKVFEALQAGASGYLLKNTSPAQILTSLQELHEGGSPMSSTIARKLVSVFQARGITRTQVDSLNSRENDILQLLSDGLLYKEIADQLSISIASVRQHIHKIYGKLHVENRTEALNKVFGKK